MMKMISNFAMLTAVLLVSACGGGDSDFNGTFVGQEVYQGGGSGVSTPVTAQLVKNGNNISGYYTTTGQGGQGSGQVTGVAQGNQISQFTVNFNQGNGGQQCPLTGSGSQTQGVITMNLAGCGQSLQVTLRRQQ